MFKQLKINLPFVEALQHMPKYAKFLKDLLSNKKKLETLSTVTLGARCSALVQNKLPEKLEDPGIFTILCLFGGSSVNHALADLGASINFMPYSIYKQLDLGEPAPTRMSLALADRSVKYPRGIVENVLVKVDKFVFPVDFVILDMQADDRVPLITGQPFLRTAKALIDVYERKISLRVGDDTVTFDVVKSMRNSSGQDDQVYFLDAFFSTMDRCLDYIRGVDLLGDKDLGDSDERVEGMGVKVQAAAIEAYLDYIPSSLAVEPSVYPTVFEVESSEPADKPSVEAPPSLELKELPPHLEYAFLDGDSDLPVIISAALTDVEKSRLIVVLREHKQAIAWKLMDIKGIHPSFCMHRILLEEDYKLVVQPQRRLNPNMGEVVKKEVLRLLDAGLIYPISDSSWVSPVHVVPKKGCMTVVVNEKKEIVPTRTVTGWRVCIDYRKLNDATRKDHFPLPFIDQMLERLLGQQYYCFLDGFSGYFQIPIAPEDQEKTTFSCPYGTFAYRCMPFGLCNAPATFQRCMVAIFQDMIETSMEVFMDDFSVFGSSFDQCLINLEKMLRRCVETNLMLNWEKCRFMVTEGIVLGHKISRDGIQVDKAKIETISKLPPPTSVKAAHSRARRAHTRLCAWVRKFEKKSETKATYHRLSPLLFTTSSTLKKTLILCSPSPYAVLHLRPPSSSTTSAVYTSDHRSATAAAAVHLSHPPHAAAHHRLRSQSTTITNLPTPPPSTVITTIHHLHLRSISRHRRLSATTVVQPQSDLSRRLQLHIIIFTFRRCLSPSSQTQPSTTAAEHHHRYPPPPFFSFSLFFPFDFQFSLEIT
ncbi:hypothetical protein E3N88_10179 [Mikania micrantha]|uniref:Reverse transcriptase domain-containing protein n=1 Tax=Mikania micrantha TaxID=192012 RepID=A0A5N6PAZ0_9ASTR|nr:hypothetical protein E3N88_10179 [Mikania micrantha]